MPRGKKRASAVIDLTGEEAQPSSQAKRPALSSSQPSRLNVGQSPSSGASSNSGFREVPIVPGSFWTPGPDGKPMCTGGFGNTPDTIIYPPPQSRDYALPSTANPQSSQSSSFPTASQASIVEEPEIQDLTQDETAPRELYGRFDGKIVGVRYYNGYASPGEVILCRREPTNQYDSNAIRITNVLNQQIGHLPRKVAEKLAPYMDNEDLTVEAKLTGEKGFYECPCKLSFYGPSDARERARIETALKKDKLVKATEVKQTRVAAEAARAESGLRNGGSTAGFGTSGQGDAPEVTLEQLLQKSDSIETRDGSDAIQTLALSEDQLAEMPKAAQPPQLKSTLLPYQLQGLAWMTAKEEPQLPAMNSEESIQLWKRTKQNNYWNVASGFITKTAPKLLSGGILADDMGLGKTLQIISLIITGGPGTTLIVAPVGVMSNWEQQIRRHVKDEHMLKTFVYRSGVKATLQQLLTYDVVITSYGKLAKEKENGNRGLLSDKANWRRVVLDEGHTIRNVKTKAAVAATELNAKSRWVLTGTPIINSVKDLQSLVKFLHITGGIEQPEIFNAVITRNLAERSSGAEKLLQALMRDICLRRKKQMKFVDLRLPKKTEYIHRIAFRPDEKRKYDALLSEARGALERYQEESDAGQKGRFQNVLERLLRLRQIERIEDLLKLLEEQDVVPLNDGNRKLLQEALRLYMESQEDCAVCYEVPKEPVITNCKHVFCRGCITRAIQYQHKCPMCRNQLTEECLLEPAPESSGDDDFDADTASSKTEALLQIVQATFKKTGSKIVIFSQWTSFLNIIQKQLEASGIKFTRIDGSMNADKRDRAMEALDSDPDTRVLLASLAVCSVGLNLVAADAVILGDSWWAPAIEDQAIDRVHRLGQTRETTVWRLVMEDTVEERVLNIQSEKRELVNKAFQEKKGKDKAKVTKVGDIKKLLA